VPTGKGFDSTGEGVEQVLGERERVVVIRDDNQADNGGFGGMAEW
jgi:hypothetical protein